jgi:hypothetical protein
LGGE